MFFSAIFVALAGILASIKPRRTCRQLRHKVWRRRHHNPRHQPPGLHRYREPPGDRLQDGNRPISRGVLRSHRNQHIQDPSLDIGQEESVTITSIGDEGIPPETSNSTRECEIECSSLRENASDSVAEPHDMPSKYNAPNTSCGFLSSMASAKDGCEQSISYQTQDSGFTDTSCSTIYYW